MKYITFILIALIPFLLSLFKMFTTGEYTSVLITGFFLLVVGFLIELPELIIKYLNPDYFEKRSEVDNLSK